MAKNSGRPKGANHDLTKRFNNGHLTLGGPESDFFREIYLKESKSRDTFQEFSHILKKPRNPCLGELTARDQAEYLLPFSTTFQRSLDEKRLEDQFNQPRDPEQDRLAVARLLTDVNKVATLRERRDILREELEALKRQTKHKQLCMTVMGAGNKTLHPALEQTMTTVKQPKI